MPYVRSCRTHHFEAYEDSIPDEVLSSSEAKSLNVNADLRSHFEGEVDLAGEVVAVSYTHLTLPTKRIV